MLDSTWIKGSPPKDKEGIYLVWLSKSRIGEYIHTYSVKKASNGFYTQGPWRPAARLRQCHDRSWVRVPVRRYGCGN